MNEDVAEGLFRGVCDHPLIIHRTVPVAARTPLLNHWLVCVVCESKVCLSLHVTPAEKRALEARADKHGTSEDSGGRPEPGSHGAGGVR